MSTPAATPGLIIRPITPPEREEFDSAMRDLAGVQTPVLAISEALMAIDPDGNTAGATYIHVRSLMGPYVLTEGAPPETLTVLGDAVAARLRAIAGAEAASDPGKTIAFDVYVPRDAPPPDGFTKLEVDVWRRTL